jgi:hypothetical protein
LKKGKRKASDVVKAGTVSPWRSETWQWAGMHEFTDVLVQ